MGNWFDEGVTMISKVITVIVLIGLAVYVGIYLYDDKDDYVELGENTAEIIVDTGEIIYETGKENTSTLLKVGEIVCDVDDFILDEINTSMINFEMKTKVDSDALRILSNMEKSGNTTACEVAILDDMLTNSENGDNLRNQIGIKKAMKNIKGCTLIACIDEYEVIKYLDDEK